MATLANVNKKASKEGTVQTDGHGYWIEIGNQIVGWSRNGRSEDATCIHTMRKGEKSDSMTDYFPQVWHDNITQAIRFAKMRNNS